MKMFALTFALTSQLLAAPYLWVTDDNSNVYVIDTGLNPPRVVETITSISTPYGLGFTPDGKYCYVCTETDPGLVYVINTSDYSFVTPYPITVDNAPYYLVVTDGYVYVANYNSSTISVISTETNEVVQTLSMGFPLTLPYPIAASPNGSYIYVGNYSSPFGVTVIATPANTPVGMPIATDPSTSDPNAIAFAPNGTAYIANYNQTFITSIANDFTVSTIPTGSESYSLAVTPDGNNVWLSNRSTPYVSVIELNNADTVVPITSPDLGASYWIAISPDGSSVYTFNDTTLNVVSTSPSHEVTSYPDVISSYPYFWAFQPEPSSSLRSFTRPNNRRF